MKLSKTKIEKIIDALTAKFRSKRNAQAHLIKEKVTEWYLESLPEKVKEVWNAGEMKKFLHQTSAVKIIGITDGGYKVYNLVSSLPAKFGRYTILRLDTKQTAACISMEQKLTELDNELKDIRASLNATINGLTEAEIIEAFPEVLVLEILKPAAAPSDIDELRKRLNQ